MGAVTAIAHNPSSILSGCSRSNLPSAACTSSAKGLYAVPAPKTPCAPRRRSSPSTGRRGLSRLAPEAYLERSRQLLGEQTVGVDVRFFFDRPDVSETSVAYKSAATVRAQIARFELAGIAGEIVPLGCIMAGDYDKPWLIDKAAKRAAAGAGEAELGSRGHRARRHHVKRRSRCDPPRSAGSRSGLRPAARSVSPSPSLPNPPAPRRYPVNARRSATRLSLGWPAR